MVWKGVKGQKSSKVRTYDKKAKNSLDSESAERAISFMRARVKEGERFFAYVGFSHFHPPWGVHPDFRNRSGTGIFADLDWYPTFAHLIGEEERIPADRPIDGVNQADFLLGEREKSNREHVVTYVGDKIFAVKWRNLKMHFAAAESTHSVVQTYTFPQFFDIKEDPSESYELWGNEGYAHAWVMGPVSKILAGFG